MATKKKEPAEAPAEEAEVEGPDMNDPTLSSAEAVAKNLGLNPHEDKSSEKEE